MQLLIVAYGPLASIVRNYKTLTLHKSKLQGPAAEASSAPGNQVLMGQKME